MTCIVGLVDGQSIIMGADSAGVNGLSISIRKDVKVFPIGEFLIGFTGSFRMGQLLHYKLELPSLSDGGELHCYMATLFIDAVRKCLKDGGYAEKKDDVESAGTFLVGIRGRLFIIHADYQVEEKQDGFNACGSGEDVALGVLFATSSLQPKQREIGRASCRERV